MKLESKGQVIPFGDIEKDVLIILSKELHSIFGIEFKISPPLSIPESVYNSRRQQYHSSYLIGYLKKVLGKNIDLTLGVIDKDLYVPQLNFVFGEAELNGNVAVISLIRLKQEFYDFPENKNIFYQRAVKEAVHEIGHVLGFHHCTNPKCVMFFSNSLSDTDRKGKHPCNNCLKKISIIK